MVFLIQNSQNRDNAAIKVKLDELIRVGEARNALVGIEHLSDEEIEDIRKRCEAAANEVIRLCGKWASGLATLQIALAVSVDRRRSPRRVERSSAAIGAIACRNGSRYLK